MLLLLPPSETKRDGGTEPALDISSLAHPRLATRRRAVVRAVARFAKTPDEMAASFKLGPKQAFEIKRNEVVTRSPTMPAIDRYTGVLYDGLDSATLSIAARDRAHEIVRIHSAMLGLVAALDMIPAYRLSYDSRLPELQLKAHWSDAVRRELAQHPGLVLDLRSGGYAALGPIPDDPRAVALRVLARDETGEVRALNHFNKKAKGEFTRALLGADELPDDVGSLLDWADAAGFELRPGAVGELELVTSSVHVGGGLRRTSPEVADGAGG
ncbi:YaaA family protein [Amnibacterium flavum]|uniref:Peroxide stress protein YaaA n=1 Tax=Amnibacterium flavum TaxID=2173173 RepID=A0A2V1HXW2_9MICO|nr:peroxide stress protein YaaA [Amnibacterium flavum]PVZ96229.1 peroxide stress protein YaaA [Amnibacterium flavum]